VAASLAVWSSTRGAVWEAPVCALAGNLPDLDRNVARALGVRRRDHHRWVSHSLVGWLPPSAVASRLARDTAAQPAVRRALACLWLHLLLDSYADGVAWGWPLSAEKVGLFRKPAWIRDRGWRTPAPLGTSMGTVEALLWSATAAGLLVRALR
jgi:LexA-binding, inner membrane-associated putative hydrolase